MQTDKLASLLATLVNRKDRQIISNLETLFKIAMREIHSLNSIQQGNIFQEARKIFLISLEGSVTNKLQDSDIRLMKELGLNLLISNELGKKVDTAIRSSKTNRDVSGKLKNIFSEIDKNYSAVKKANIGFKAIGIKDYAVEHKECEFKFCIPRNCVDNELHEFSKELGKFNTILKVFDSISENPVDQFEIRTISSSDLTIAINVSVDLGLILSSAVLGVYLLHKAIKDQKDKVESLDLPKKIINEINVWSKKEYENGISEIIKNIETDCNESINKLEFKRLSGTINGALVDFSSRIQEGYTIEFSCNFDETTEKRELGKKQKGSKVSQNLKALEKQKRLFHKVIQNSEKIKNINQETPVRYLTDNESK